MHGMAQVLGEWYEDTTRLDWLGWSPAAARRALAVWRECAGADPGLTTMELYEWMLDYIREDDEQHT